LLASVGINAVSINNVNVHRAETAFITGAALPEIKKIADVFASYGISTYLSVNFAAPITLGGLDSADPLDGRVRRFWEEAIAGIYRQIPHFGGFVVKADSEGEPGPFTYGRSHDDGANMLADAIRPFGGIIIWRCFVYNCEQDWRDRTLDRAKAAYDIFMGLDGHFADNVALQIKNGPIDFQIREPHSPLFGALRKTNQILEFQITQEYTGQQKHVCYLVPMWKETLDFDTGHGDGPKAGPGVASAASPASAGNGASAAPVWAAPQISDGGAMAPTEVVPPAGVGAAMQAPAQVKHLLGANSPRPALSGVAGVVNVGMDANWTGNKLAQANLYGYGRLAWDDGLSSEAIAAEWVALSFSLDADAAAKVVRILATSRQAFENYTCPLGVGFMCKPGHHYGVDVDGYEYDRWGTYHYADREGVGRDRTLATGTAYTRQYADGRFAQYEDLSTCPDEVLLFFHHVPYTHVLRSGKTVIQHIYDSHFDGVAQVEAYRADWESLRGLLDEESFSNVAGRLEEQLRGAIDWRDQVNTYFYRKSGIPDAHGRVVYP
ncbi:MAG: hypothetical protein LBR77_02975, partial [Lachnospiraceae bacterium]|nr:hypothetical protein [Lachnospiraceae bacterium]